MSLKPLILYSHPLASFCHKVLIALYEKDLPFEARMVDLADDESSAAFRNVWPVGKMPVLRDLNRGQTVPETSIIIEYLDIQYSATRRLIPRDLSEALEVRKWDRFFDLYVQVPMQKIVSNRLRAGADVDGVGEREARATLKTAYEMLERQLRGKTFAVTGEFSMADCAAAPALFYAETVEAFSRHYPAINSYYERLLNRPSFAQVLEEAKPYLQYYPYKEKLSARFL